MDIRDSILDKWIEFSGGSRPGTNMLRFQRQNHGVILQIHYVFDWETGETGDLQFQLSQDEYSELAKGLTREGYAKLEKKDDEQTLLFEWRLSEGRVAFRVEGYGQSPFHGRLGYHQVGFRDLIMDDLLAAG